jgi:hypothetical protein
MDADSRPGYQQVAMPIDAPRVISRRTALIGLGSATAALLGVVADRTIFGIGSAALSPAPATPTAPPPSPDERLVVNLRPVKPYDWVTEPFLGLGGRNPANGSAHDFVWSLAFEQEAPSVSAVAVELFAVATPAAIGEILDLSLATPEHLAFERLRDMGFPEDLAQIQAANGTAPTVGDLWVILPRDRPWPTGDYAVTAVTEAGTHVFKFKLT